MMGEAKPSLAELQALVLKGIAHGDDGALELVKPPPKDSAETMFGVYRNAYMLRVAEFLGNDYPRLKIHVGEDKFRALSRAYAAAYPSDTSNARWYSRHLPELLDRQAPWAEHRALAELARIERGLNDAFDSADAPVFTAEGLQVLDPAHFESAVLILHPSVHCLRLRTNAAGLWSDLKEGREPPEAALLPEPVGVVIWRQGGTSKLRELPPEEAMALEAVAEGVPFGVLCEMIATMGEVESAAMRAGAYLQQWLTAEMVSEIRAPRTVAGELSRG